MNESPQAPNEPYSGCATMSAKKMLLPMSVCLWFGGGGVRAHCVLWPLRLCSRGWNLYLGFQGVIGGKHMKRPHMGGGVSSAQLPPPPPTPAGMQNFEFIFLARKLEEDKPNLMARLQTFVDDNFPFWFLIFPEGTTVHEEYIEKSQKFAEQTNRPVLHKTVLPRVNGLAVVLDTIPENTKVCVPAGTPAVCSFLPTISRPGAPTAVGCFPVAVEIRRRLASDALPSGCRCRHPPVPQLLLPRGRCWFACSFSEPRTLSLSVSLQSL